MDFTVADPNGRGFKLPVIWLTRKGDLVCAPEPELQEFMAAIGTDPANHELFGLFITGVQGLRSTYGLYDDAEIDADLQETEEGCAKTVLRSLTPDEIERYATMRGADRATVETFLGTVGGMTLTDAENRRDCACEGQSGPTCAAIWAGMWKATPHRRDGGA